MAQIRTENELRYHFNISEQKPILKKCNEGDVEFTTEYVKWLEKRYLDKTVDIVKEQHEQMKSALTKLVDLKHYKDDCGKDSFYLENQPQAWEYAREVLRKCGVRVD